VFMGEVEPRHCLRSPPLRCQNSGVHFSSLFPESGDPGGKPRRFLLSGDQ